MSTPVKILLLTALLLIVVGANWANATSWLYPIKTSISEPIWSAAVSFFPKASGEWAITKANRRFYEANQLARANLFGGSEKIKFEAVINANIATAQMKAEALSASDRLLDAAKVQSDLEAVLMGNREAIFYIKEQEDLHALADSFSDVEESITKKRAEYDQAITDHIAEKQVYVVMDSKLYELDGDIRSAVVDYDNNKASIPQQPLTSIGNKIESAKAGLEEARGFHNGEQSKFAFVAANKAERFMRIASILIDQREGY